MIAQVSITESGRMSLPADMRKRMGLASGGTVYAEETPDGILIRTHEQIVASARSRAKPYVDRAASPLEPFPTVDMADPVE